MLALDTNVLVYAHRQSTAYHRQALKLVRDLGEGLQPFALFWPSLYEFVRVVTHHRVFSPPSTVKQAIEAVRQFLDSPLVRILTETPNHLTILERILRSSPAPGNLIHDAHLVALALEHGVHEILTTDADFKRFPQVSSRNPFLSS